MSYVALATTTLGSAASSVTFSSIPATYKDLVIVVNGSTGSNSLVWSRINGDTGSNYAYVVMAGANTVYSGSGTFNVAYLSDATVTANTRILIQYSIMDYSATDKHKTALVRSNSEFAGGSGVYASAHRWANTNAVTSVSVNTNTGTWNVGTTVSLYGIA
jgi:hypothetical protein